MAGSEDLNQATNWQGLVKGLEGRIESLTLALDEVRFIVRQLAIEALTSSLSESDESSPPSSVYAPHVSTTQDWPSPPATAPEPAPAAWERLDYKLPPVDAGWGSLHSFAEPETPHPSAITPQPPSPEPARFGAGTPWQEPAVSWPGFPSSTPVPEPEPDPERDEVRRAVEQMRAEINHSAPVWELDDDPASAPKELQERASEHSTGGEPRLSNPQAEVWPAAYVPQAPSPAEYKTPADGQAQRDEVRRAVEMARQELESGTLPFADMPGRSEGASGVYAPSQTNHESFEPGATPAAEPQAEVSATSAPPTMTFEYHPEERVSMPSIIIEDPEGRVELVSVYDTLNRVNCADQAVLLNYTPHSVTVGLGPVGLPEMDALKDAVRAVFSRPCEVTTDGYRISVVINNGQERAA